MRAFGGFTPLSAGQGEVIRINLEYRHNQSTMADTGRAYQIAEVVELDYHDLVEGKDLTAQIERAFGVDGVGVLTVKNVPNFVQARQKLLPLAKTFADLPEETKGKYVHKESYYAFGWSHGKENVSLLQLVFYLSCLTPPCYSIYYSLKASLTCPRARSMRILSTIAP
ncbi:hypothetical protein EON65_48870 [archaeon]|nr:MAG: hypothetical protein EON65_48870 [archaeon]